MLTGAFVSPFRKTLRRLRTICSSKGYKTTEETKIVIDTVRIGHEKEAEFKTFATEDIVIGMVYIEVVQDTKFDEIAISLEDVNSEGSSYCKHYLCSRQGVRKDRHLYTP